MLRYLDLNIDFITWANIIPKSDARLDTKFSFVAYAHFLLQLDALEVLIAAIFYRKLCYFSAAFAIFE